MKPKSNLWDHVGSLESAETSLLLPAKHLEYYEAELQDRATEAEIRG
jgi:hypothetical protein